MEKSNPIINITWYCHFSKIFSKIISEELSYFLSEELSDNSLKYFIDHDQKIYLECLESVIQRIYPKFFISCIYDFKVERVEKLINIGQFEKAYELLNFISISKPKNSLKIQNIERLFKILSEYGYSRQGKTVDSSKSILPPLIDSSAQETFSVPFSKENNSKQHSPIDDKSLHFSPQMIMVPSDEKGLFDNAGRKNQTFSDLPSKPEIHEINLHREKPTLQINVSNNALEVNQDIQNSSFSIQSSIEMQNQLNFIKTQSIIPPQQPSKNDMNLQVIGSEKIIFKETDLSEVAMTKENNLSEVDLSENKDQNQKGLMSKFTSLFSFGKSAERIEDNGAAINNNKPHSKRANLGEPNSFYYDESLKRWINSKDKESIKMEKEEVIAQPPLLTGIKIFIILFRTTSRFRNGIFL